MPNNPEPPTPLSLARFREKLARYRARRLAESGDLNHAAVALILREAAPGNEQEILIIRRAEGSVTSCPLYLTATIIVDPNEEYPDIPVVQ